MTLETTDIINALDISTLDLHETGIDIETTETSDSLEPDSITCPQTTSSCNEPGTSICTGEDSYRQCGTQWSPDDNCPVWSPDQPCPSGQPCIDGACCIPDCTDKACGDDSCGGSCGTCFEGLPCVDGVCAQCDDGNQVDWVGCTDYQPGEAQVNISVFGNQHKPTVAGLPDGGFAVLWHTYGDLDKDIASGGKYPSDLMLRIHDKNGVPTTEEIWIAGNICFTGATPAAMFNENGLAIAWAQKKDCYQSITVALNLSSVNTSSGKTMVQQLIEDKKQSTMIVPDIDQLPGGGLLMAYNDTGNSDMYNIYETGIKVTAFNEPPAKRLALLRSMKIIETSRRLS